MSTPFSIQLPWKTFSVDMPTVDANMKALDASYVGNSAGSELTLWFTNDPTIVPDGGESTADQVQTYWDAIISTSPIATAYTANKQMAAIELAVGEAIDFGMQMIKSMTAQNVALGITQAGKTKVVRQTLADVVDCLQGGSLQDAIAELKAIPTASYDSTFITAARLLAACNQIEAECGLPLSTSLS